MTFRVWLSARLGADGMGLYSLIMTVFAFGVTLATSGIHLAVTRMIAEERAVGHYAGVRRVMRTALSGSALLGGFAGLLLFLFAGPVSVFWLKEPDAAAALRILAAALPAMAISGAVGGYFTGSRQAYKNALLSLFSQLSEIAVTAFLLCFVFSSSYRSATEAIAIGCVSGEVLCAVSGLLLFFRDLSRLPHSGGSTAEPRHRLCRIALPIAVTSYARSALLTLEHVLIPIGLIAYGAAKTDALASYGIIHAMVMPTVLFPMALVSAVAGLIVPELAEYRAGEKAGQISRGVTRLLRITLLYAVGVAAVFLAFGDEIGLLFFDSAEAGRYLRILGALVPVMYLDHITDAALKGLDQQVAVMRYNLADSALCVLAVWLLLPHYGADGYVFILFASELFNASLSIGRLFAVSRARLLPLRHLFLPIICAGGGAALCRLLFSALRIAYFSPVSSVLSHTLLFLLFYTAFLLITGCLPRPSRRH